MIEAGASAFDLISRPLSWVRGTRNHAEELAAATRHVANGSFPSGENRDLLLSVAARADQAVADMEQAERELALVFLSLCESRKTTGNT